MAKRRLLCFWLGLTALGLDCAAASPPVDQGRGKVVCILPIREDIMPPLVYLVRRGVKEAMREGADLLVLDMETNGGRADSTLEIIDILDKFPGHTVTYVNRTAYSAGAFIAAATERIFMAPESVIGAAAPIMIGPGGTGVQEMSGTMEAKITSALAARIRAYAQKYGHNTAVIEAMIDKGKELVVDGETLCAKGEILTLTNREAERRVGDPPKPLLSEGTVPTLEALLERLGCAQARRVRLEPLGAERLATWLNSLSWLWLIIGVAGIYIEMKTPGFGLPGVVGILGFALYFAGSYVAGLAGWEWAALFLLGLLMVALEIFVWPGVVVLGAVGALLVFVALIMALVDMYPGMPPIPSWPQLELPAKTLSVAFLGSAGAIYLMSRWLPRTPIYPALVTRLVSGSESVRQIQSHQQTLLGRSGVALSALRPSGKAQFGEEIVDVITQGEMIDRGAKVRVIGFSGSSAVVEPAE